MKYVLLPTAIMLISMVILFPEDNTILTQVDLTSQNQEDSSKSDESFYPLTMDELEERIVIDSNMLPDTLVPARPEILPYSVSRIVKELKLFGVYEDSISKPQLELFVRNKIDSMKFEESVKPLHKLTELCKKYSFKELPCIEMYIYEGPPMTPFTGTLFNTCDSTIYLFKDCAPRFSRVIRKHLPEIIEKNKLLDLVNLYLHASSGGNAYFILSGIEDYRDIWKDAIAEKVLPFLVDTVKIIAEKDIETLRKSVYWINIHESGNNNKRFFSIGLRTWEWLGGKIEAWDFRISDRVFEVQTRFPKFLEKGPCYKNLRRF